MTNPVVTLRAAIIEAAETLSGEDGLTISLELQGDALVLSLGSDDLPSVPLLNSLTDAMMNLAGEVSEALDEKAEENLSAFQSQFNNELEDIRCLADINDDTQMGEWESILEEIIQNAQKIKRNMDCAELEDSEKLKEAGESLRSQMDMFVASTTPVALVS